MSKNRYSQTVVNGVKNYTHRHVMQEKLGRSLQTHEHVYHLNGDPKDNRPENLVVVIKKYDKD